jgi:hypothetical protein
MDNFGLDIIFGNVAGSMLILIPLPANRVEKSALKVERERNTFILRHLLTLCSMLLPAHAGTSVHLMLNPAQ